MLQKIKQYFPLITRVTGVFSFILFVACLGFFLDRVFLDRIQDINTYSDLSAYYFAGQALTHGFNFYDVTQAIPFAKEVLSYGQDIGPFLYPPVLLCFFVPLTIFSYANVQIFWTVLILISLIFVAREIYLVKNKKFPYWLFLILILVFFPVTRIFDLGQVELFILLGLFITLRLHNKNCQKSAGIVLGIIGALKIYPLFFLIFFALKKRWQTLVFSLATFLIIVVLSFVVLPNSQVNYYIHDVFPKLITGEASSSTVNGQLSYAGTKYWPSNQSLTGFFYHNLTQQEVNQGFINNPQLAEILRLVFSGIIFFTTLITIYYYRHQKIDTLLFSLLILTFVLINPLSWPHYLALSLLPIFFILNSILKTGLRKNIVYIFFLALSFILLALKINPWQDYIRQSGGSLMMSLGALGLIILYITLEVFILKKSTQKVTF